MNLLKTERVHNKGMYIYMTNQTKYVGWRDSEGGEIGRFGAGGARYRGGAKDKSHHEQSREIIHFVINFWILTPMIIKQSLYSHSWLTIFLI